MKFARDYIQDRMTGELLGIEPHQLQRTLRDEIDRELHELGNSQTRTVLDTLMEHHVELGDLDAVKWLEGAGAGLVENADILARLAAATGWPLIVRHLFERRPEAQIDEYQVMLLASIVGRVHVIEELLDLGVRPEADNHHVLLDAARLGHRGIVLRFLRSDPGIAPSVIDASLRTAAREGHFEIVRALIPVCNNPAAIIAAVEDAEAAHARNVVSLLCRKIPSGSISRN